MPLRHESARYLGICLPLVPACAAEYTDIVATRDVTDFEETGVELVNPWG